MGRADVRPGVCQGCGTDAAGEGPLCEACAAIDLAPSLGLRGEPGLAPTLARHHLPVPGDLTAMIASAAPDATLTLGAGTYMLTAPLHLSHARRIQGAGLDQTRVIAAPALRGPLVHVHMAAGGLLELLDLTIVYAPDWGDREADIVRVTAGHLRVTRCRLEGTEAVGGAGVRLRSDAELTLDSAEIVGTGGCGLRAMEDARVEMTHVSLSAHAGFGMWVGDRAAVTATQLTARGNGRGGAAVEGLGRLELVGGAIVANGRRGVLIRTAAACRLRESAFERNAGPGVEVCSAGALTLEGNQIRGNRGAGVMMGEGARADARANACEENSEDGFAVFRGARAHLVDNGVSRNGRYGIWVGTGGEAALEGNAAGDNRAGEYMAAYAAVIAPEGQGGAIFGRRSDRAVRPSFERGRPGGYRQRR